MSTNKALLIVIPVLALAGCRQDMQDQPKYKPLAESQFFGDHRSARPAIEGTVARGHLRLDQAMFTGKVNNSDIDYFPVPITRADVVRGQQRFNIYCSPCHSRLGTGEGMIVRRGFRQPPSYFIPRLMDAPAGHFFDVMTNGFGAMPSYASRVSPSDRWRVIAYIRALQFSMRGKPGDAPPGYLDQHPEPLPFGPQANPAVAPAIVPHSTPSGGAPPARQVAPVKGAQR